MGVKTIIGAYSRLRKSRANGHRTDSGPKSDMSTRISRQELVGALRSALMQLDDYDHLRHNPLLRLIHPIDPSPSPVKLQRRLVGAIQSLQDASDAKAQYYYRVLHFRYIEQIGQIELASQLGISERQ